MSSRMENIVLAEQVVVLDETLEENWSSLPDAPGLDEHLHRLESERKAAYSQMQRMVSDLGTLRNVHERTLSVGARVALDSVFRLALAAVYRGGGSAVQVQRQGVMGALLAEALGCDSNYCDRLQAALPLMDLGHVALPDRVVLDIPPEAAEGDVWRRHTLVGHGLLNGSSVPEIRMGAEIALTHHERFDGRGYPGAVSGPAIPLSGRIAAVVDRFDALTRRHHSRTEMTPELAAEVVIEASGTRFDPQVIEAFRAIRGILLTVRRLLDERSLSPELLARFNAPPEPGGWRRFRG